jgi:hypothetical protein
MALSLLGGTDGSFGLTDCTLAGAPNYGLRLATTMVEDNNYETVNDLDTRLQAIDGTTYTQTYLRTLSKNDKMYALRLATADAATIR